MEKFHLIELPRQRTILKKEEFVLVGNTDDIFSESRQHFNEDIHPPVHAARVAHRISIDPNAGQSIRRLKTQKSLWPSEQNFKSNSTACDSADGYSVSHRDFLRSQLNANRFSKTKSPSTSCAWALHGGEGGAEAGRFKSP